LVPLFKHIVLVQSSEVRAKQFIGENAWEGEEGEEAEEVGRSIRLQQSRA
jgi:hypothetical protein